MEQNVKVSEIIEELGMEHLLAGGHCPEPLYYQDLVEFAQQVVLEVCIMINAHVQHNNPNDCLLVLDIKEKFGME